jgi:Zn-finger nucleic acid-binding protein
MSPVGGPGGGDKYAGYSSGAPSYTVGKWWEKHHGQHAAFKSALEGKEMSCPKCDHTLLERRGYAYACASCDGSFVENAALIEMVTEMTGQPWMLPSLVGTPGLRACPACATPMVTEPIEGVPIDRCAADGVWFDAQELPQLLASTATPHESHDEKSWLRRLFGSSNLPEATVVKR